MEESVSTDLRSDISFMNRQKELRMLYRDFRSALDTFHSVSPNTTRTTTSIVQEDEVEEDEDENEYDEEPLNNDIELIIQDIDLMTAETEEILSLISKPKFRTNSRVQSIRKQLVHLQRVNSNLRARAESLLDNDE